MHPSLHTSKKQDWVTPDWLFTKLDREFHFGLDAAASDLNHKCEKYFTEADDGLKQKWGALCGVIPRITRRSRNG